MNSARKTLFWVVVLLLVGAGFYLVDEKATEQERIVEFNLRMFPFEVADVDEFWINATADGIRARAQRRDGEWWLKEPLTARGDSEDIESLLRNVVEARKDRTLFEQADDAKLRELGLGPPALEMGFIVGGTTTTIQFGGQGPTHNVAYAMLAGDPRVFRIHADVSSEADKQAYDLRDKSILTFDPVKLKRFEMVRPGQPELVVVHDNGKWNITAPNPARAAMDKVLEGLYKIRDSETKAFLGSAPTDRAMHGIDTPRVHLTVFDEQRDEPYVLIVGDKDRKRRGYFAVTNRSDDLIVIEEDLVNYLLSVKDSWQEPQP